MKIFILERPGKSLDQMLEWLAEAQNVTGIYSFENEIHFIDQVGINNPKVCIIRTCWGALQGLRIAEMVRQISPKSKIIMLSETKDYAMEAFEVGVHGYLLYPLEKAKFTDTIAWAGNN